MDDDMNEIPMSPETPAEAMPATDGAVVVQQRRGPGLHVATIVGILALLGAGVFAFKNISGSKSGGSTPEAAVQSLLDAVSNEDLIGVLQQLDPGERDAFRDSVERIRNELVRLGALEKNASLSGFPGIDITFKDVKFATTALGSDVSVVRFTGGTVTTTVDPAKLPLGPFLRNLRSGASTKPTTTTDTLGKNDDEYVATVRRGGRWYASLFYSIAESARKDSGAPVPNFGNGVPARGAASPEKAMDAFLRAAAQFDVEGLVALTPPDEMAALHDYAQLFINEAALSIRELTGNVQASITSLELGSDPIDGSSKFVFVKKIGLRVTTPDGTVTANYDGNCLTTTGGGEFLPPLVCGDELAKNTPAFLQVPHGRAGFVVVESGGAWYFSPVRTVLENVVSSLKAMKPGDLDKIKSLLEGLTGGITGFASGSQTLTVPADGYPKGFPTNFPSGFPTALPGYSGG